MDGIYGPGTGWFPDTTATSPEVSDGKDVKHASYASTHQPGSLDTPSTGLPAVLPPKSLSASDRKALEALRAQAARGESTKLKDAVKSHVRALLARPPSPYVEQLLEHALVALGGADMNAACVRGFVKGLRAKGKAPERDAGCTPAGAPPATTALAALVRCLGGGTMSTERLEQVLDGLPAGIHDRERQFRRFFLRTLCECLAPLTDSDRIACLLQGAVRRGDDRLYSVVLHSVAWWQLSPDQVGALVTRSIAIAGDHVASEIVVALSEVESPPDGDAWLARALAACQAHLQFTDPVMGTDWKKRIESIAGTLSFANFWNMKEHTDLLLTRVAEAMFKAALRRERFSPHADSGLDLRSARWSDEDRGCRWLLQIDGILPEAERARRWPAWLQAFREAAPTLRPLALFHLCQEFGAFQSLRPAIEQASFDNQVRGLVSQAAVLSPPQLAAAALGIAMQSRPFMEVGSEFYGYKFEKLPAAPRGDCLAPLYECFEKPMKSDPPTAAGLGALGFAFETAAQFRRPLALPLAQHLEHVVRLGPVLEPKAWLMLATGLCLAHTPSRRVDGKAAEGTAATLQDHIDQAVAAVHKASPSTCDSEACRAIFAQALALAQAPERALEPPGAGHPVTLDGNDLLDLLELAFVIPAWCERPGFEYEQTLNLLEKLPCPEAVRVELILRAAHGRDLDLSHDGLLVLHRAFLYRVAQDQRKPIESKAQPKAGDFATGSAVHFDSRLPRLDYLALLQFYEAYAFKADIVGLYRLDDKAAAGRRAPKWRGDLDLLDAWQAQAREMLSSKTGRVAVQRIETMREHVRSALKAEGVTAGSTAMRKAGVASDLVLSNAQAAVASALQRAQEGIEQAREAFQDIEPQLRLLASQPAQLRQALPATLPLPRLVLLLPILGRSMHGANAQPQACTAVLEALVAGRPAEQAAVVMRELAMAWGGAAMKKPVHEALLATVGAGGASAATSAQMLEALGEARRSAGTPTVDGKA